MSELLFIASSIGLGMGMRSLLRTEILGRKSINYRIKYLLVANQDKPLKPFECDACLTFWAAGVLYIIEAPEILLYSLTSYFLINLINRIWL